MASAHCCSEPLFELGALSCWRTAISLAGAYKFSKLFPHSVRERRIEWEEKTDLRMTDILFGSCNLGLSVLGTQPPQARSLSSISRSLHRNKHMTESIREQSYTDFVVSQTYR